MRALWTNRHPIREPSSPAAGVGVIVIDFMTRALRRDAFTSVRRRVAACAPGDPSSATAVSCEKWLAAAG
jgi:hypothetical protein